MKLKQLLQNLILHHGSHDDDITDPSTAGPHTKGIPNPHQMIFTSGGLQKPEIKENSNAWLVEDLTTQMEDKRNFKGQTKLWDKGLIPYTFSTSQPISDGNKKKIRDMMMKIENSTCIEWKYVEPDSEEYRVIIEDGSGCHSRTGNINSDHGYQILSLKQDVCMQDGTILHELGHVVGLEHEQSRPDRDKYIIIHWENLNGGENNPNFAIEDNDAMTYNVPFDHSSVMLYSPYTMARHQGSKTFEAKDRFLEELAMEDRHDLSFYDKLLISRAYDCTEHCDPKSCIHGHFLGKNCTCVCPNGLTGDNCDSIIQEGHCHSENRLVIGSVGDNVTVESPNYPNRYQTGSVCRWLIEGPVGSKLRVTILDMDIAEADGHCIHWLELRCNLIAQPGPELCGDSQGQMVSFTTQDYSEANTMMLSFIATNNAPSFDSRGFKLEFKAIPGNDATKPVNFCENVECQNGGTCQYNDNNFWCSCVNEFRGRHCEESSDVSTDPDTVFSCASDNAITDECAHIDLGDCWDYINGHFKLKEGQKGTANLQIPYLISRLDQQYCLHFKVSRAGTQEQTCPHLRFIVTKEMVFYGFLLVYEEYLLFDDNCSRRTDTGESLSFTSQSKITEMKFRVENINDDGSTIELSHFQLQLGTCS
ncbi:protein SpAN-like isoform X2 [Argopecten irradians]